MTTLTNTDSRLPIESQIRNLSSSELEEPDFVQQLAEVMASACNAELFWVLMVDENGTEVLSDDEKDLDSYLKTESLHAGFAVRLKVAIATNRTLTLRLNRGRDAHGKLKGASSSGEAAFFCPVQCDVDSNIVICLYRQHCSETEMNSLTQQLGALTVVCESRKSAAKVKAIQDEANQQQDELRQTNASLREALGFGETIATSLEKEKASFVLANELQHFLKVDRVTVIEKTGKRFQVLAVSGRPTFDRRSNVIRHTQHLAQTVLQSGEEFWFDENQEGLVGPVEQAVTAYVEESLVQSFAVIPIQERLAPYYRSEEQSLVEVINPGRTEKRELRGAILVESIQDPLDKESIKSRLEPVHVQVENHFNNTKRYSDLFFLPVMLMLTKFAAFYRGHTKRLAWALTLGAVFFLLAGFLIPADFRVRCEGYLQPETMHHVFVREDGVVMEVLVKEGQMVRQGDSLVTLKNRELELDLATLFGELEEKLQARKNLIYHRLAAVNQPSDQTQDQSYSEMAQQTGLLDSQIRSLEKNLALKRKQQQDLIVKAPFDGQIMGWNVDRKFLNRPLDQGTRLFSLAKDNGRRVLELKVPDQRSGYVATAWREVRQDNETLPVEFSIASFPGQRFDGEVTHINPGLEQDSDLGYVLPVEARPGSDLPKELRSGLPVVAKVICGKRSFFYCKTYEFTDWIHRTTFEFLF